VELFFVASEQRLEKPTSTAVVHGGWELVAAEVGMMLCQISLNIHQIRWILVECLILELMFVFVVEVVVRWLKCWDLVLLGNTIVLQHAEFLNGVDLTPPLSKAEVAPSRCGALCTTTSSTSRMACHKGGP
jgi:hypothetical protein